MLVQIPLDQNLLSKWWLLEGTGALTRSRKEEWWFKLSTETRQHINRLFNSGQRWTLLLDKYTGPLSVVLVVFIILLECTFTSWPSPQPLLFMRLIIKTSFEIQCSPKYWYCLELKVGIYYLGMSFGSFTWAEIQYRILVNAQLLRVSGVEH